MHLSRTRKRILSTIAAACGAVTLLVAVPAAQATVGGTCKLNTPSAPQLIHENGQPYIYSSSVMWCERDAWVTNGGSRLVWSSGTAHGTRYNWLANAGWRYVLDVKFRCTRGAIYNVQARTEFTGPDEFVHNTSGYTRIVCN